MARTTATVTFQALELKGSLLPASLLEEVSKFNRPKGWPMSAASAPFATCATTAWCLHLQQRWH